jgi:hypothetical protein
MDSFCRWQQWKSGPHGLAYLIQYNNVTLTNFDKYNGLQDYNFSSLLTHSKLHIQGWGESTHILVIVVKM